MTFVAAAVTAAAPLALLVTLLVIASSRDAGLSSTV
jgi:hypothetical protein